MRNTAKTMELAGEVLRKVLTEKIEREWVGLTDEEILAITLDAKITEPNDEPIKFGAPSRKCIKDLVSGVEARLKEKNCA
jgi:LEA14-like dessication related protein